MGIIRGGLLFFAGILFLISLLVGNILLTMILSLSYENVKIEFADVVKKNVDVNFNQNFLKMQTDCQNRSEYILNLNVYDQSSISVPCSVVSQGQDSVINYVVEDILNESYYKKYDCKLFDCPSEKSAPFVYVSEHAKDYWKNWLYYSLFASLILIILIFLLIENKGGMFIDVGGLIIFSSLPLLFLNWIVSNFNFADILFSKAKIVFWMVFIIGLILVSVGIALKFWNFWERDADISKKEIKDSKENIKSKKK